MKKNCLRILVFVFTVSIFIAGCVENPQEKKYPKPIIAADKGTEPAKWDAINREKEIEKPEQIAVEIEEIPVAEEYIVQKGDNYYLISKRFCGTAKHGLKIWRANKDAEAKINPGDKNKYKKSGHIEPGWRIIVPPCGK